jgi:hypothetical protein
LIAEQATIPPSGPRSAAPFQARVLPDNYRIDLEDLPARPERHIPNSIATMRVRLIYALVKILPRCPCCGTAAA